MVKGKKISLIIPARNEEEGLKKLIQGLPKFIDEVIVVDNGSTDNTFKVAKELGVKAVKEERTLGGIGYGYAHITGIKHATGDYIAAMDADDTYPAGDISGIVEKMLVEKLDFVSCSRLPLKNPEAISKTRQLGIKILNLEMFLLYGLRIKDTLTGMWVFDAKVKEALNLKMGDWNLSPEIKINAIINPEIEFAECHINHFSRVGVSEQVIWETGFNHLFYILKKRFTEDIKYLSVMSYFKKPHIVFSGISIL
jgi:glycosyltransferase involved in cell wall biosynthesis